ncbi:MAG: hypothetical protein ABH871_07070 [Pseudomonadota bacterium]
MNLQRVVRNVLHIPRNFRKLGNISVHTLLKEGGYFEVYSLVSVGDIRASLISEPQCIEEWLLYSEDKRCSSGWYFMQTEKHSYIVGHYPSDNKLNVTYDDSLDACADFIKKEIEDIRQSG